MEQDEKIEQLQADIEFLRVLVKDLISRIPAHPVDDAPLYGAIKDFNEARGLSDPERQIRNAACDRFGMQSIHRKVKPA